MFFKDISTKFVKFLKLLLNNTTRRGLYFNIAASIELEELIKDLKINVIIDVGSNKGQFILLAEKLFKNIEILSFEPISELYEKQKKFFKNKTNINFFNIGLGSNKSRMILNITRKKDSSSFLKIKDSILLGKEFNIIEKREILISTLDDILKNYNLTGSILLKLDVQGYELEVLKGSSTILKKIKYIIIEIPDKQLYVKQDIGNSILNYLEIHNFKILKSCNLYNIKSINYSQKDFLLVNKSILNKNDQ